jgi:ankyrin repeat protein
MSLSERATAARLPHSRMFVAHGASLDTRNSLGNSAPMTAARDGDEKVVAIRLEAGADAGLRNKSRQNARDIARAAGRTAIAEMMK